VVVHRSLIGLTIVLKFALQNLCKKKPAHLFFSFFLCVREPLFNGSFSVERGHFVFFAFCACDPFVFLLLSAERLPGEFFFTFLFGRETVACNSYLNAITLTWNAFCAQLLKLICNCLLN